MKTLQQRLDKLDEIALEYAMCQYNSALRDVIIRKVKNLFTLHSEDLYGELCLNNLYIDSDTNDNGLVELAGVIINDEIELTYSELSDINDTLAEVWRMSELDNHRMNETYKTL